MSAARPFGSEDDSADVVERLSSQIRRRQGDEHGRSLERAKDNGNTDVLGLRDRDAVHNQQAAGPRQPAQTWCSLPCPS